MKKTRVKSLSRKQPYNMTLGGATNDRLINGCGNIILPYFNISFNAENKYHQSTGYLNCIKILQRLGSYLQLHDVL